MEAYQLIGKTVKAKLCRYGFPVGTVRVTNVQGATMGNVRGIDAETGASVMCLYPPIEVL